MGRRRLRLPVALVAFAFGVTGCAGSGGPEQPAATPTTAVRVAPDGAKGVSKADSVAAMERACVAFYRAEPADPGDTATFPQMRAFAQGRTRSLAIGLADSASVPFRPADFALRDLVHNDLAGARSIYLEVLALPASSTPARANPLMASGQRLLIEAAVALINFGAKKCAPPAQEAAAPPGRGAGPLVSVAPTAVIAVGAPGLDNKSIAADSAAAWVAVAREPSIVRIDRDTNTVVARIALPNAITQPIQLVDGRLWVATPTELVRIDERTNRIDWRIGIAAVGPPDSGFAVTGNTLWTCDVEVLHRIDITTRNRAPDVHLPGACQVLTAAGDHITVSYGTIGSTFVAQVDAATGRVREPLRLPGLHSTWGMLETPSGRLFIDAQDIVQEVDLTQGRIVHSVRRGGRPGNQLALGADALFLTRQDEQRIVRYDLVSGRLEEVTGGPGVNGIAYYDGSIWATNSDAGTVMRYPGDFGDGGASTPTK